MNSNTITTKRQHRISGPTAGVTQASASVAQQTRGEALVVSTASDETLLLAYCRSSHKAAYAELVRRYERELYNYLRRYLGSDTAAEDAFQATFLQVHLKCAQFEEGRTFRPWLYTIATHQAIDLQRRSKRHRMLSLDRQAETSFGAKNPIDLLESSEASPTVQLEAIERQEWVREAVASLAEPLRAVVALVYYQGLMYREAAEILGIPVGTVKSRLHAAVWKLNELWNAESAGASPQPGPQL